jgi:dTDP-4-dehydrorhamnose reductase
MTDKILIFGNGQLGNFYSRHFTKSGIDNKIAVGVDITFPDQVLKSIEEYNPTVVINTAAKTNLEWTATNKLDSFNINVLGAENIAKVCDEKNIYFIHLSSGCILASVDENDSKTEDAPVCPFVLFLDQGLAENMIGFKNHQISNI